MLSDDEFRVFLHELDRPWTGFRKVRKGVKKRLRRHMQALDCSTIEQYIDHLHRHPAAMAACQEQLRVTISRFFRDRHLWRVLQERILPGLAGRFAGTIRAWSAGCACGEEPYSLAMVWSELGRPADLDLLATDANRAGLARARAGRYPRSSLKEVPDSLREKYFELKRGGRQFLIRAHRLPTIRWQQHDLLDPPPAGPVHLILLRNNLLTYYQSDLLRKAFEGIIAVLPPGGCLLTGSHERLPESPVSLTRDMGCPWVYWRKNAL